MSFFIDVSPYPSLAIRFISCVCGRVCTFATFVNNYNCNMCIIIGPSHKGGAVCMFSLSYCFLSDFSNSASVSQQFSIFLSAVKRRDKGWQLLLAKVRMLIGRVGIFIPYKLFNTHPLMRGPCGPQKTLSGVCSVVIRIPERTVYPIVHNTEPLHCITNFFHSGICTPINLVFWLHYFVFGVRADKLVQTSKFFCKSGWGLKVVIWTDFVASDGYNLRNKALCLIVYCVQWCTIPIP